MDANGLNGTKISRAKLGAMILAFLMVSAGFVAVIQIVTVNVAAEDDLPSEYFVGYKVGTTIDGSDGTWEEDDLGMNYMEGDRVAYQLRIDNTSEIWGATDLDIKFTFYEPSTDAIFIDGFDTSDTGFQYTYTEEMLGINVMIPASGWGTHIPTPEAGEAAGSGATITNYMHVWDGSSDSDASPDVERYFTISDLPWEDFSDGYVIIYFRAHSALSIIWQEDLESNLPLQLSGDEFDPLSSWGSGTNHNGSSYAKSSSRHFTLMMPEGDDISVPIPRLNYPLNIINGQKFLNDKVYDGWGITLAGKIWLWGTTGANYVYIDYTPAMVYTGQGTWPDGYFVFTGLPRGNYTVTEETIAGYSLNLMSSFPVLVNPYYDWVNDVYHPNPIGTTGYVDMQRATRIAYYTQSFNFFNYGNPSIDIEKYVWDGSVWLDADSAAAAPYLSASDGDVQFKLNITNTDNTELTDISVTDDMYGNVVLPTTTLDMHKSMEVTYSVAWSAGQHVNNATVKGYFYPLNVWVSDKDAAYYFGAAPAIDIEKYVWDGDSWEDADEAPGVYLLSGTVTFKIVVRNTGNVELTGITVTDDMEGTISFTGTLAAGAEANTTYTMSWASGQNINTATVTGYFGDEDYSDSDSACYFGAAPAIDIEKYVWDGDSWEDADEAPGVYLLSGTVTFKIVVRNTGNVELTGITVTDDMEGTISFTGTLAAGAEANTTYTMSWASGQNINTATVTGYFGDEDYSDSDSACYFGAAPAIDIEKYVWDGDSWEDADEAPGVYLLSGTVTFKIVVRNTGNVELTGITVTDDMEGTISFTGTLAAGAEANTTYTMSWASGQNINTATVTGYFGDEDYSDSDSACYFGAAPAIDIEKYVWDGDSWEDADEAPGVYLLSGTVTFKIVVRNTGNVELTGITVTDDMEGTISFTGTLAAGAEANTTYTMSWASGQNINTATVTGYFGDEDYSDSDSACYFGAAPAIDIEKYVWDGDSWEDADEAPGVYLLSGTVTFKIVVRNTGNVELTGITVTDDMEGTISFTGTLAAGAEANTTYTMSWASGQNINTATVTGYFGDEDYSDSDSACYFGAAPAIDIEKYVWDGDSWEDADEAPGVYLLSGTVTFKIVVRNTGNVELTGITVTDDMEGTISFTGTLAAGAEANTTYTMSWASGQNINTATVTGYFGDEDYSDSDSACYFGAAPAIDIEKYVWDGDSWEDADEAPGVYLLSGTVTFKIVVRNTGNVELTGITVTDDMEGTISFTGTLAAGAEANTTYTMSWASGQNINTATVTGYFGDEDYSDSDSACYFGAAPAIDIEKYVWDGDSWEDADEAPGVYLLSGTVTFKIVVRNTGNVELTGITVTDDMEGTISFTGTLAAGAEANTTYTMSWASGQNINTATVTGYFGDEDYSDSDSACYFGAAPAIDIEKYVWDGDSWEDADEAPGVYLLSGTVTFKIVVRNTGNVELTGITVTDDMEGTISFTGTLAAGAEANTTYTMSWASGQNINTATVTGYFGDEDYSDSDSACYFGAAPAIDIEKYVWDGDSWEDADEAPGVYLLSGTVTFKIVVRNTGNVELTGITVTDDMEGTISFTGTLAAGAEANTTYTMSWASGQNINTATVTGYFGDEDYSDSDSACYFGAAPAIDIEKYVWDSEHQHRYGHRLLRR